MDALKLHTLTACSRPENLSTIAQGLARAQAAAVDLTWHVRLDLERQHVGGQALKNAMLDGITDGWCWILDDDTAVHPAFFQALHATTRMTPYATMIVIAQQHRNGWVRHVDRRMLRQTHVDAGQVVMRRDLIDDRRIPLHYCGDGEWIEQIAADLDDARIAYVTAPATYYNWLRSEDTP